MEAALATVTETERDGVRAAAKAMLKALEAHAADAEIVMGASRVLS